MYELHGFRSVEKVEEKRLKREEIILSEAALERQRMFQEKVRAQFAGKRACLETFGCPTIRV